MVIEQILLTIWPVSASQQFTSAVPKETAVTTPLLTVTLDVPLPHFNVGHVITFPFLSLHVAVNIAFHVGRELSHGAAKADEAWSLSLQTPCAERRHGEAEPLRDVRFGESLRLVIYVRPFPDVNSGHWQVSTAGGTRPLWARSGQELFYVSPAGALMRVGVERSSSWAATTPTMLVKQGYVTNPGNPGRTYDVSSDGQRFLMIKEGAGSDQSAAPASLIVVQHWTEELKRLVPTK